MTSSRLLEAFSNVLSQRSLNCGGRCSLHLCFTLSPFGVVFVLWCSLRLSIVACCLSRFCFSEYRILNG